VLPAAGWQINLLKKEFMPEGIIFGHNTLYFDHPQASPLQKAFVTDYMDRYKEAPHWEAERAYFALVAYKAGVEAAQKAANKWPTQEQVAGSHARPGSREAWAAWAASARTRSLNRSFYQGPSTNNNKYDFPTLASIDSFSAAQLQKPPGVDFWEWIKNGKMPV
jgi:branched-chain amino acid transport system substrate-binding protein